MCGFTNSGEFVGKCFCQHQSTTIRLAFTAAKADGLPARRQLLLVQNLPHLLSQCAWSEWFLNEEYGKFQKPVANDRIIRIA